MKSGILAVVLLLSFQGCVSYRKCQDASGAMYKIGVAHGKAESSMARFNQLLAERPARYRAQEIIAAENADKSFAELADDAACETDEKFMADPNTSEEIRTILMKAVERCRTRKQEKALDRITERTIK